MKNKHIIIVNIISKIPQNSEEWKIIKKDWPSTPVVGMRLNNKNIGLPQNEYCRLQVGIHCNNHNSITNNTFSIV